MKHPSWILVFAFALFAVSQARSCTCEVFSDGSPRSEMHHAKAVFIGEVLEVRKATTAEQEDLFGPYIVRLRVERFWKGVKHSEVLVETDLTGCGPHFKVGQKYLVYGMRKQLHTGCTRTRLLDQADEELKALGPGKELKKK